MKRVLFSMIFFILFLIPCLAQDSTNCPKIMVSDSKNKYYPGEPMPFSVSITKGENQKLEYVWETSAGLIIEGVETPSITIDSAGLEDIVVKVIVEIKGLPKNCENKFHVEAFVEPTLPIADPDEISGPQTNNKIKSLADTLYSQLRKNSTKIGVVIIDGTDKEFSTRQAQFVKALKSRKHDISRIKFVRGSSYPGIRMRIFIAPIEKAAKQN